MLYLLCPWLNINCFNCIKPFSIISSSFIQKKKILCNSVVLWGHAMAPQTSKLKPR